MTATQTLVELQPPFKEKDLDLLLRQHDLPLADWESDTAAKLLSYLNKYSVAIAEEDGKLILIEDTYAIKVLYEHADDPSEQLRPDHCKRDLSTDWTIRHAVTRKASSFAAAAQSMANLLRCDFAVSTGYFILQYTVSDPRDTEDHPQFPGILYQEKRQWFNGKLKPCAYCPRGYVYEGTQLTWGKMEL